MVKMDTLAGPKPNQKYRWTIASSGVVAGLVTSTTQIEQLPKTVAETDS